ncbi:glycosyltransferase [Mucilaginibacter flavus]|uniref:glycosyltransferase n=1 Tax=Mucilaginibacter flavus TaxID=931504 RepID=UPI0025B54F09|nr:glycosyltransferase [Mucilaginibacter flavus]MDN3584425.1 glycosyltransferase [Mucilaginibacter flavus]
MKKVLIISPYFPPSNAADMQRVRMSLPYFSTLGWKAEVVCVDPAYSDMVKDERLLLSLPDDQTVHKIRAVPLKWSRKIGFGSLGYRSLWFYLRAVNKILQKGDVDLIYFSTTQFPVCVLGPYWLRKFGVPYVIDMQDPWYSDYYEDKPKAARPPNYRIVYWLHRRMEAITMKRVGGLVSVSQDYLTILQQRYPELEPVPSEVITFGAFEKDFEIVQQNQQLLAAARRRLDQRFLNYVYVGRGGADMAQAVSLLFEGFREGLLKNKAVFSKIRFHFLGTSYAPAGTGIPSILPIAQKMGVSEFVSEQTDRLPYYETIAMLLASDGLILPGSDSPGYTASKLFPYIMAKKPLLAIFYKGSSTLSILRQCSPCSHIFTLPGESDDGFFEVYRILEQWATEKPTVNQYDEKSFSIFSAPAMANRQVLLFNRVLDNQ